MFYTSNARLMSGIFCLILVSACANVPQTEKLKGHPPVDIAPRVILSQVEFFAQQAYQCGPASLATVLNYQGVNVSPDELVDKVYIPQRKGSLQLEMLASARSYGFLVYPVEPELSVLIKEINHGNPVLVFQNLSLESWPQWHYAVAIGYDLDKAELILHSGTIPEYRLEFSTFEQTWQRAKYWAYIVIPPGEVPLTAKPVSFIQACDDLQKTGYAEAALESFRSAGERWPEQSLVLMALGNAEFAAGNYIAAIGAFSRELNIRDKNATAWNNLAYAQVANNCKKVALESVSCAKSLLPDDINIRKSLAEIRTMTVSNSGQCKPVRCPQGFK